MNEAYTRLSSNYQALQEKQATAEKNFKDLNDQFEAVRKVVQTAKESLSQITQTSKDVTKMGKEINATTTGFLGDVEEAAENIKKVNKSVIEELEKSGVSVLRNEIGEVRAWQATRDLQIKVDAWCKDKTSAGYRYGDIASWDVSEVEDFSFLFSNKASCNPDISKWNVGKATNMRFMFWNANSFNADISEWDTSKVTTMSGMFLSASSFNADISTWDTSKVTAMASLFQYATIFSTNISNWDTSKVTNMRGMFDNAINFNADISRWNTSKVDDMFYMFNSATKFNQPGICSWDHSKVTVCDDMFTGSGMNCPSWNCPQTP
jgi:surface protein